MANIKVVGDAVVITGDFTPDDIKLLRKHSPKSLILEDENGDPAFAVGWDDLSAGGVNGVSATFGGETRDALHRATITLPLRPLIGDGETGEEAIKDAILDRLGAALFGIGELEQGIKDKAAEIRAGLRSLREHISVG